MYLRSSDLPHYLINRGIVTRESIVEGNFCVASAVGRHQHFFVRRGRHMPLFVKQTRSQQTELKAALRREAACYGLLNADARFAKLAAVAPRFVDFDAARNALIVEWLTATENLRERHRRRGLPSDVVFQALGRSLADCHSSGESLTTTSAPEEFPREPARILSAHRAVLPHDTFGMGVRHLMTLLCQAPRLLAAFDKLHSQWCYETLIHGDMKWENCLTDVDGEANDCLRFVDWEMADVGDAAWDVAGILHSFYVASVVNVPVAVLADLATLPPWSVAMETFLSSYFASRPLATSEEFRDRCWSYTGVRLIQAAFESAHVANQLDELALTLFQAGQDLVLQPDGRTRPSLRFLVP